MDSVKYVQHWLQQQGIRATRLTRLGGYTNQVFLIEQNQPPYQSVIRMGRAELSASECPLAHQAADVIQRHQEAAALGLAPALWGQAQQGVSIMWLPYKGSPKPIIPSAWSLSGIQAMLHTLHTSGLDWSVHSCQDVAGLQALQQLLASPGEAGVYTKSVGRLLQQGRQRGYAQYPQVPVHGDLNPGNWLHDGRRWWLIDWDFAGMNVAGWDYASLIVEQGWREEQVWPYLSRAPISVQDLRWFAASFAVLSRNWHVQHGSPAAVLAEKTHWMDYWLQANALS